MQAICSFFQKNNFLTIKKRTFSFLKPSTSSIHPTFINKKQKVAYQQISIKQIHPGFGLIHFYSKKSLITPKEKKNFIYSTYLRIIQSHLTFLLVKQNNINSKSWRRLRKQLHTVNAKIKVIRNHLFIRALQTIRTDTNEYRDKSIPLELKINALEVLETLFSGPTAIITLADRAEPSSLKYIIDLINKSNNQLQLLGGLFENELADTEMLLSIKALPDRSILHTQLICSLIAGSNKLLQILQYPSKTLALTLDTRVHTQIPEDISTASKTTI
ncbi:unnamed protein product [Pneumocystis jirovecii]|uniref:Ribosomal protein L10 n=2 Tax=Pneumocystis jirovecii TaxID=42068 RepID=L0PE71_PNEJI|nr:uncharacterized protein T551_03326 [Pneumocystis jirovecii RU7]KTW26864.1 hypothetical protein T551_03326 [Pneumocystis jirovecii RU7]CCJ30369.1 unnamed protein product [Pneumocystis jirovecii]